MIQVQIRMPEKTVDEIDKWVESGKFKSRSDAIKTIVAFFEEREKTMKFLKMLAKRSDESKNNPGILIPFEEV
ncbi:MAG: ribbon-helix-helix protein, CopG family [Candidatus Aenigmarchaeota archaeon]|nr:ribbon-helix-helix protein, CopG family [Candidatus Aenigmarchaeota archaeon]